MASTYATRMQAVADARYSLFHTTPLTVLKHIKGPVIIHGEDCTCKHKTFWSVLIVMGWNSWRYQTVRYSFDIIWLYAVAIAAIANLSKNGWKLEWPPREQIDQIAQHLYMTHCSIMISLDGPWFEGFESGFYVRVGVSVIAIPVILIGLVLLGVLLVACYRWYQRLGELIGLPPRTFAEFRQRQAARFARIPQDCERLAREVDAFTDALFLRADEVIRVITMGRVQRLFTRLIGNVRNAAQGEGGPQDGPGVVGDDDEGRETMDEDAEAELHRLELELRRQELETHRQLNRVESLIETLRRPRVRMNEARETMDEDAEAAADDDASEQSISQARKLKVD